MRCTLISTAFPGICTQNTSNLGITFFGIRDSNRILRIIIKLSSQIKDHYSLKLDEPRNNNNKFLSARQHTNKRGIFLSLALYSNLPKLSLSFRKKKIPQSVEILRRQTKKIPKNENNPTTDYTINPSAGLGCSLGGIERPEEM